MMSFISRSIYSLIQALLLILGFSLSPQIHADEDYSQLIIFGDSLSDTGNLASILGGFPAPYDPARVSNGPVAVETLASQLELPLLPSLHLLGAAQGTNYAVASARAISEQPVDLATQLTSYFVNNGFVADPDALYVLFLGGNDIRDARGITQLRQARAHVRQAATSVADVMQQLAQSGAKHFLVVNSPDIGAIPETLMLADIYPGITQRARQLSQLYRSALKREVKKIKRQYDIELTQFDLMKYFRKITRRASQLGFEYTTEPCFNSITAQFHEACVYGQNAHLFLYFDEIHPTSRLHQIIGNAFYEALD